MIIPYHLLAYQLVITLFIYLYNTPFLKTKGRRYAVISLALSYISFELFLNNGTSSQLLITNGRLRLHQHPEVTPHIARNQMLQDKNVIQAMSHKKTGTTIVGCKFRDGVVLAADTRATGGSIVVEKNC